MVIIVVVLVVVFICDKNYELYSFFFLVVLRVELLVRRIESGDIVVIFVFLFIIRL